VEHEHQRIVAGGQEAAEFVCGELVWSQLKLWPMRHDDNGK